MRNKVHSIIFVHTCSPAPVGIKWLEDLRRRCERERSNPLSD